MNQLNSLIIEGNVTRLPELREPKEGFKVCTIPIAVNRFYRNNKGEVVNEVSYFSVETYGKMAELCMERCDKGRGIRVVGRIKQSRWTTAEGKPTSKVYIVADHVEFRKRNVPQIDIPEELKAMADANNVAIKKELDLEQDSNEYDLEQTDDEVPEAARNIDEAEAVF